MTDFTHLDSEGRVRMVDVGDKKESKRVAVVMGSISMEAQTLELILDELIGNRILFQYPALVAVAIGTGILEIETRGGGLIILVREFIDLFPATVFAGDPHFKVIIFPALNIELGHK